MMTTLALFNCTTELYIFCAVLSTDVPYFVTPVRPNHPAGPDSGLRRTETGIREPASGTRIISTGNPRAPDSRLRLLSTGTGNP